MIADIRTIMNVYHCLSTKKRCLKLRLSTLLVTMRAYERIIIDKSSQNKVNPVHCFTTRILLLFIGVSLKLGKISMCIISKSDPAVWVILLTLVFASIISSPAKAETLRRLPFNRETILGAHSLTKAVILIPDEEPYHQIGNNLAEAIRNKTGVVVPVESAKSFVTENPRQVKDGMLDRNFILLGQFWNNAVLERLYCRYFDATDAYFPGAGGYELRTVCDPFKSGQNCLVVTGSDEAGCSKAVESFVDKISMTENQVAVPFLHTVILGPKAAKWENKRQQALTAVLKDIDRYAVFNHPQAKIWTSEDPHDFMVWHDRNLAGAACLGIHYWLTANKKDLEGFKRLLFGCMSQLDRLEQGYKDNRVDLMDYSGPALVLAWDMLEETDAFTDAERQKITDYLYHLAMLNRNAYYIINSKNVPIDEMAFETRHHISGNMWFWLEAEYMMRNCALDPEQKRIATEWKTQSERYLDRIGQNPYYSSNQGFIMDEGELATRWTLASGKMDFFNSGNFRSLADYWVSTVDSRGRAILDRSNSVANQQLARIADWMYPGEGYASLLRNTKIPYFYQFVFYASAMHGHAFSVFAWGYHTPLRSNSLKVMKSRMDGVFVCPLGTGLHDYLNKFGRIDPYLPNYSYDPTPYNQEGNRITLRTGFQKDDQFFVLTGMQGSYYSLGEINSISSYMDFGTSLLRNQAQNKPIESTLDMNSLTISTGKPYGQQSIAGKLVDCTDLGKYAMVANRVERHGCAGWTRRIFWQKHGWFVVADETEAKESGQHSSIQSWFTQAAVELKGHEAISRCGKVSLHIAGTTSNSMEDIENEVIRQTANVYIAKGDKHTIWTLMYAEGPGRTIDWHVKQISPNAVLLSSTKDSSAIAFTGAIDLENVHIDTSMGIISKEGLYLSGCKRISIDGKDVFSSADGKAIGWNLQANTFDHGKSGFALQPGADASQLSGYKSSVVKAIEEHILKESKAEAYGALSGSSAHSDQPIKQISPIKKLALATPMNLAHADLLGNGNDEFLLYKEDGSLRFPIPNSYQELASNPSLKAYGKTVLRGNPVVLSGDGKTKDIVIGLPTSVEVRSYTGDLKWKKEYVGNSVLSINSGKYGKENKESVGVTLGNNASILSSAGSELSSEDIYRYTSIGGIFGDVDGDGQQEFIAVTSMAANILKPGRSRQTILFDQKLSNKPCRLWLKDFDGSGSPKLYLGGEGSTMTCVDLKNLKSAWTFNTMPVNPNDAAILESKTPANTKIICAGNDGFLYALDTNGKFLFSQAVGDKVQSLEVVNMPGTSVRLAVGLSNGKLALMDDNLNKLAETESIGEPVTQIAVLKKSGIDSIIVAAGKSGASAWFDISKN